MTVTIVLHGKPEKLTASTALLNHLCIALNESADYNESLGWHGVADQLRNESDQVYNALYSMGVYDGSGVLIEAIDND